MLRLVGPEPGASLSAPPATGTEDGAGATGTSLPGGAAAPVSYGGNITDAAGFAALRDEWLDLVARCAEPNVFMEPAFALALSATGDAGLHAVLAWRREPGRSAILAGAWLLAEAKPSSRLPFRVLACPANALMFLGSPVIDRMDAVATFTAMLDAIEADARLPKTLCANFIAADGPVLPALREALAHRGASATEVERRRRAILHLGPSERDAADCATMSRKHRSELRRKRRKLSEAGRLEHVSYRAPEEIDAQVRPFLALEAAGWKGGSRAIQLDDAATRFATAMIRELGECGNVGIDALRLDGRPIAMNVWLRSGSGVFGWKMAYDESFGRYSPGNLLMEDLVASFAADPSVTFVDSCNRHDRTPLAQLWAGRRTTIDLVFHARSGGSPIGDLLVASEVWFRRGRNGAKRLYRALAKRGWVRPISVSGR
jgi:CelD/BcsL family acetyltransferase involved in cellulose biosynthesis